MLFSSQEFKTFDMYKYDKWLLFDRKKYLMSIHNVIIRRLGRERKNNYYKKYKFYRIYDIIRKETYKKNLLISM